MGSRSGTSEAGRSVSTSMTLRSPSTKSQSSRMCPRVPLSGSSLAWMRHVGKLEMPLVSSEMPIYSRKWRRLKLSSKETVNCSESLCRLLLLTLLSCFCRQFIPVKCVQMVVAYRHESSLRILYKAYHHSMYLLQCTKLFLGFILEVSTDFA